MADIMSIVSTAHKSNVLSGPQDSSTYVPVDSWLYQGSWTGTYPVGRKFPLDVSRVSGFRAQVRDGSTGTSQYQQVPIDLSRHGGCRARRLIVRR
ncbi:hypothetical protein XI09_13400 [Bradyrhizobium sp. CCBAU 11386]|uniref:hypothetical protein n=1 Tax=Bradyrhizobium sp. CCBAU 11386 TaxID=1630837 RepID=UPI002303C9C3|nr:hypothetical protein [Bradyrhizobium sp. CCBAU 11386]MDA9505629.1 hypothetical protein [Bradyrhizobium sp. CCBAU 11386]